MEALNQGKSVVLSWASVSGHFFRLGLGLLLALAFGSRRAGLVFWWQRPVAKRPNESSFYLTMISPSGRLLGLTIKKNVVVHGRDGEERKKCDPGLHSRETGLRPSAGFGWINRMVGSFPGLFP